MTVGRCDGHANRTQAAEPEERRRRAFHSARTLSGMPAENNGRRKGPSATAVSAAAPLSCNMRDGIRGVRRFAKPERTYFTFRSNQSWQA